MRPKHQLLAASRVRGDWHTFHGITSDVHLAEDLKKHHGPGTLVGDQWLLAVDQSWENGDAFAVHA